MICYHLIPFQLIGVHGGVQSAHGQSELAIKYPASQEDDPAGLYHAWASSQKTLCFLHAGGAENLLAWEAFLSSQDHPYPWSSFREDKRCLLEMITNVSVVLPERMSLFKGPIAAVMNRLDAAIRFNQVFNTWEENEAFGEAVDSASHHSPSTFKVRKLDFEGCTRQTYLFTISVDDEGRKFISGLELKIDNGTSKVRHHYTAFDLELIRRMSSCRLAV